MYAKLSKFIGSYRNYPVDIQLIVLLNLLVAILSVVTITATVLIDAQGVVKIFWVFAFLISLLFVEGGLQDKWQGKVVDWSVYIYSFILIPLGVVVAGSITMPMAMYVNLGLLLINLVATKRQMWIVNPFIVVFVFLYIVFEYYNPNYMFIVPSGEELVKHYLIFLPIGQVMMIVIGISMTKAYRSEQKLLAQKNEELESLMRVDMLTGLYNKQFLNEQIGLYMAMAKRTKTPMSILVIDIDFFKKYNDLYGHIQGDKCLIRVAEVLQSTARRDSDEIFRFGGEEFVALLGSTDEDSALLVAQELLDNIKRAKIAHNGSDIAEHLTLSIGVYTYSGEFGITSENAIQKADKALYQAKNSGRNMLCIG